MAFTSTRHSTHITRTATPITSNSHLRIFHRVTFQRLFRTAVCFSHARSQAQSVTPSQRLNPNTSRPCLVSCSARHHQHKVDEATSSWQNGVASVTMAVRDYELDQFGVVNNAIYASYFQHCRHEVLADLGFDVDASARAGKPLALSELRLTFRAPLRSRDKFRVSCWVDKVGGARLVLGQSIEMLPPRQPQEDIAQQAEPQLVAQAVAEVVWLDASYRPTRLPMAVRNAMVELLDQRLKASANTEMI